MIECHIYVRGWAPVTLPSNLLNGSCKWIIRDLYSLVPRLRSLFVLNGIQSYDHQLSTFQGQYSSTGTAPQLAVFQTQGFDIIVSSTPLSSTLINKAQLMEKPRCSCGFPVWSNWWVDVVWLLAAGIECRRWTGRGRQNRWVFISPILDFHFRWGTWLLNNSSMVCS